MIPVTRLSRDGADRMFSGFQARFNSEPDTNKVIRDATDMLPGFGRIMESNLNQLTQKRSYGSLTLKRAFEQSVADVIAANNPRLFPEAANLAVLASLIPSKRSKTVRRRKTKGQTK